MAQATPNAPITLEDVRIIFRNFTGAEGRYNRKGDRNFSVVLSAEQAEYLQGLGFNVKFPGPREDGEIPDPRLAVKVKYSENGRPPRAVLINSRGKTNLTEESISILDWARIEHVDMIIRAFQWELDGASGVTAYLNAIYVTISEDELELKYADVEDSAVSSIMTEH